MHDSASFVRRVRSLLEDLSATERKLAEFLLEFPGELASYTASELATLAQVSNSTVSRFIRRLGYDSYEDARRHAREERESGSPLFQAASKGRGADTLALHLQQSQLNLEQTFYRIHPEQLTDIVHAMSSAPQVLIFGSRSSNAFARYLRWQVFQVLPRVTLIPGPGETLGEYVAGLGKQDFVIIFGLRRQTRQMVALLQAAARAQTRILLISDQTSPDFKEATWSIQCQCAGPGPLDNHVAVMALCDLLATQLMETVGPAARKRLAAIEISHEEIGEF